MGQRCDCGMTNPSLTWCPVFLLEVGFINFPSLLSGISFKVPSLSPESLSTLMSLVHSGGGGVLPTPIPQGCLFPFFLLALRASVLFPHPIPDQVPLSPSLHPHSQTCPLSFPGPFMNQMDLTDIYITFHPKTNKQTNTCLLSISWYLLQNQP